MINLNENFWSQRYQKRETGWDLGIVSTPLKDYFDQLRDKNSSILIPGAGNAHEAEYLLNSGFKNITILDISPEPLKNIRERIPKFPTDKLILGDFFDHSKKYDLIIEQTFFCAIDPSLRKKYAKKMHELLHEKGKLIGVLFNDTLHSDSSPPFGGNKEEYSTYFEPYFLFNTFAPCYNSIKPRTDRELFIIFETK
jgi:thiopurine S-methyltransferase